VAGIDPAVVGQGEDFFVNRVEQGARVALLEIGATAAAN